MKITILCLLLAVCATHAQDEGAPAEPAAEGGAGGASSEEATTVQVTEATTAAAKDPEIANIDIDKYCNLPCGKEVNTVCALKCELGKKCGDKYKNQPLTDDERQHILDLHNYLRNYVAVGKDKRGGNDEASNMLALNYDKEHEEPTLCWGRQCTFEHDKCRRTQSYETAGQNLYKSSRSDDKYDGADVYWNQSIVLWYQEIEDTSREIMQKFESPKDKMVGHFTQLVWAKTKSVGCSRVHYSEADKYEVLILCNYGPAGNVLGAAVYEFGAQASKCPDDLKPNKDYPGLCGEITKIGTSKEIQPPYQPETESKSSVVHTDFALALFMFALAVYNYF